MLWNDFMVRTARLTLLLVACLSLTGCLRTTFSYSERTDDRKEEIGRTFLIGGLVDTNEPLRAYDFCPEGISSVQTVHSFGDLVLSCLTIGIYTPNTVRITCQGGAAHQFYLDDDDHVVAHEAFDVDGTPLSNRAYSDVF